MFVLLSEITRSNNNSRKFCMMQRTVSIILSVFCLVTAFYGQTSYQTSSGVSSPNTAPGSPIGSYALSGFESVNPYSGKLNFSLPLLSVGGRGNTGYTINLKLQKSWSIEHNINDRNIYLPGSETYEILHSYHPTDQRLGSDIEIIAGPGIMKGTLGGTNRQYWLCGTQPCYDETLTRLTFEQSDGTQIEFRDVLYGGRAIRDFDSTLSRSRGTHWVSTDGTNATFISSMDIYDFQLKGGDYPFFPSGTLYLANGTKYTIQNGGVSEIIDINGNKATTTKDSLGREISFTQNMNPTTYEIYDKTITHKGTSGAPRNIKIDYSSLEDRLAAGYEINGLFALPPPSDPPQQSFLYNPAVIANVELPDGRKYEFKYNDFGELAEVKLPTGGRIEYVWEATSGLYPIVGSPGDEFQVSRRIQKRSVYESNVLQNETVYGYPAQDYSVTVQTYQNDNGTLVLANITKHYYADSPLLGVHPVPRPTEDPFWLSGREMRTEIYDASGTLLRKVVNRWEWGTPLAANPTALINIRLAEVTETLADTNQVSRKTFSYDGFNNQTDVYEYDYDVGESTVLKRHTHTDYLNDANYTSHTMAHLRGLPTESWVSSDISGANKTARTEFKYDETALTPRENVIGWTSPTHLYRGNLTRTISHLKYAGEPDNEMETRAEYDVLGNVVKTFDAKGNHTTIDYTDRFGTATGEARDNWDTITKPAHLTGLSTFAFPTSATNTLGWVTGYSQVDYYTGAAVDAEDINGNVSSIFYNDALDRPTQVIAANNRPLLRSQRTTVYDDDEDRKVTTTADLYSFGDNLSKAESFYDTLGRTVETRSYKDGTYVAVNTEYDALGRPHRQSNPYRLNEITPSNPIRWTVSRFDNAGRLKEVETPDGAKVKTAYHGTRTLVTDQAGKQRMSRTNALGQLSDVWEITPADSSTVAVSFPNQTLSAGYQTSYTYDLLNNLTQVNQGGQTRTFQYDSLSRLKRATNPELGTTPTNGTIQYQYDSNGNLTNKTDARGVQTTYVYDALNRVSSRSYANEPSGQLPTPNVTYTYDNLPNAKGKLTKVTTTGTGSNTFTAVTDYQAFDILGRVTQSQQTTDGTTYGTPMTYTYNLSGAMIEQKYPSGRVVKAVLDNDGDLALVQSKKNDNTGFFNYAKSFRYTAAGAVSSMQLGNGKWESTAFNSRLQPTQIALGGTQNATNLLKLNFDYGTTQNNGNVLSQTITVPSETRNNTTYAAFTNVQNYSYDSLNRLKQADEKPLGYTQTQCDQNPAQCWKQTFNYDRFGNRNFDTANNNTTTLPLNCATAVCNPTVDPATNKLVGYVFDNAGNTKTDANGQTFIYDGENKQVQVSNTNGVVGQYFYDGDGKRVKKFVPSTGETTVFVYDASGKMVAEYSTIVAPPSEAKVSYLTADHLGSPRINTDANGAVIARHDYQPFGEEIARPSYGADATRKKFTSYERDNESSLDYAKARYYGYTFGRFTSPDSPLLDQSSSDPQSWNLYVYAGNSPLKYTDPLGLWKQVECEGGSSKCWEAEEGDTYESLAEQLGVSAENLGEFFQNQEVVEGRVFDVSGYNDWMKEGDWLKKMVNDSSAQMGRAEPPGVGGLKTVGKRSGLFGWIGKKAGQVGRWAGILSKPQVRTVAEMASKKLVGSSAKEALKDATNILKSFKGSPQEKVELFKEYAKQINARFPEWAAKSQTAMDGATIFAGEMGETLVISATGEMFRGSYGQGAWKVTTEGYKVFYEAMKKID
jgi:RHS repeat-associated protein